MSTALLCFQFSFHRIIMSSELLLQNYMFLVFSFTFGVSIFY